jgi:hypothetical protein
VNLVDPRGEPIEQATISFSYDVGEGGGGGEPPRFRFAPFVHRFVDPSARAWVNVQETSGADGQRLGAVIAGPFTPQDGEVEVVLPPERTIAGEVLDQEGAPLAGVVVRALAPHPGEGRVYLSCVDHGRAATNSRGRFVIDGLGELPYVVSADPPEGLAQGEFPIVAGGEESPAIRLAPEVVATVTVVDEKGRPIPGAFPRVHVPIEPEGARLELAGGFADEGGRVGFRGLCATGRYELSVMHGMTRRDIRAASVFPWEPRDTTLVARKGRLR